MKRIRQVYCCDDMISLITYRFRGHSICNLLRQWGRNSCACADISGIVGKHFDLLVPAAEEYTLPEKRRAPVSSILPEEGNSWWQRWVGSTTPGSMGAVGECLRLPFRSPSSLSI